MRNRVLLVVVPIAFGLNAWLGERVKVGEMCPVLTSPAAVEAPAAGTDVASIPAACALQCKSRATGPAS